jgi:L-fuculose-phosphate aldolase
VKFQQARETVLATCLALAERGYLAGTGGNIALRADEDHLAVTPSTIDYYAMTAADICVLRLSDESQLEGENPASVEAGMHAAILRARLDCNASIHTHQPIASAYTLLAKPLNVEDKTARLILGSTVPCVAYAPSGTGLLAWRVGRAFKPGTHACLMRNHGVVCVGIDAAEAMNRVATLESACAAFFHAHATDNSLPVDESVRSLVAETLRSAL